jgi:threonine dehydrogenase-like Zn-dependent dehydrogenase
MHKYLKPLLKRVENGDIDPTFLISHRIGIEEVPDMYRIWRDKKDQVTKIVIDPWQDRLGEPLAP